MIVSCSNLVRETANLKPVHFEQCVNDHVSSALQSIIAAHEIYGDEDAPVADVHWWNDISLIKGFSGFGLSLSSGNQGEAGWKKALLLAS
mgnify:FL=1